MKTNVASFAVDAQNGFTPNCPYELPVHGGDEIVKDILFMESITTFHIGSKDWHNSNAVWVATEMCPQFTPVENEENCDIRWNRHCEGGTYGAELISGLNPPESYDYFVWKGMERNLHPYSAVYHDLKKRMSTGVIEVLKLNNINVVVVAGLATDYCVKETALDLRGAGFDVVIYLPACRGISSQTIEAALNDMQTAGIIICQNELSLTTFMSGE